VFHPAVSHLVAVVVLAKFPAVLAAVWLRQVVSLLAVAQVKLAVVVAVLRVLAASLVVVAQAKSAVALVAVAGLVAAVAVLPYPHPVLVMLPVRAVCNHPVVAVMRHRQVQAVMLVAVANLLAV
jgi:hypothetical protein